MSTDSPQPTDPDDEQEQAIAARLIDLPIEDELKDSYLTYAMSVIVSRALPDARDGLKPSQRRILVAMNDLNLSPGASRVKCAKISGDTSGNYHPHGESVIYPTLVRMAQEWNMRHVLVDKQGNFGSIAGLPPAAMRYTEARMSPVRGVDARGPEARHGRLRSPPTTNVTPNRPFCPRDSPTCWSTVRPASPWAWRPASRRTIWAKYVAA